MRTKTSWLALLMTAGMAWAPATAWGQDYTPPDPVIPLPLFHDRPETGGFYATGEFNYWRMSNPLAHQVIATRGIRDVDGTITADLSGQRIFPLTAGQPSFILPGPRRPGLFYGSNTPALFADDAKNPQTYQPGFSFGVGWKFANGVAVDVEWLHLTQAKYSATATLAPPNLLIGDLNAESFLYSPVFNFPNHFAGPDQKVAVGAPLAAFGIWNGASNENITFFQRYEQVNINGRFPIYQDDCNRCYALLGGRMIWLWERFRWRTEAISFDGTSNQDDVAIYSNIVSQRMYGPQVGTGYERRLGDTPIGTFSLSVDLQAALLLDVVKERSKYERADHAISAQRNRNDFAVVPELQANANLWWYPIEGIQIRVGYDFMSFFNTVASPNPVSFNYGALNPTWEKGFTRFIDGFHAGIAFIF